MKNLTIIGPGFLCALITVIVFGCTNSSDNFDLTAYKKEMEVWHANRLQRLTSENGWLTLVGLYWLKEGKNPFGSDTTNTVILPAGKTAPVAGTLTLDHGIVRMETAPGTEARIKDSAVTAATLHDDGEGATDPTIVRIGTVSFYVIKRDGQLGIRVKDSQSATRLNFKGLDYYPVNADYRFEARYEPYSPPKMIKIATMINTVEEDSCPGALVFDHDGKQQRLDVVIETGSDNEFFIMFSDETSGKDTYGMGRQVYTSLPDANGKVILDFNKAYNWPCVFTEFATCPIPPSQNHLPFRVEAGEKMYSGHKE